jgi:hypothetical protein
MEQVWSCQGPERFWFGMSIEVFYLIYFGSGLLMFVAGFYAGREYMRLKIKKVLDKFKQIQENL